MINLMNDKMFLLKKFKVLEVLFLILDVSQCDIGLKFLFDFKDN